jgi:hypothetical protein
MGKNTGKGKGSHVRWTSDDETAFVNIMGATHLDAEHGLKALQARFPERTFSGLRSRMEVLFKRKQILRTANHGIPGAVYRLLLSKRAKLDAHVVGFKKRKASKAKTKPEKAVGKVFLPAVECATVTGYASGTSVARLGRAGKVKRKKLEDGSFVYDVEAVKAEAKKASHLIGGWQKARTKVVEAAATPTNGLSVFVDKLAQYRDWAEVSANIHMLDAESAAKIIDAVDVVIGLTTGKVPA